MTPTQAAEYLAAKRTDAPSRYALLSDAELGDALTVAWSAALKHTHEHAITLALKEIRNAH